MQKKRTLFCLCGVMLWGGTCRAQHITPEQYKRAFAGEAAESRDLGETPYRRLSFDPNILVNPPIRTVSAPPQTDSFKIARAQTTDRQHTEPLRLLSMLLVGALVVLLPTRFYLRRNRHRT